MREQKEETKPLFCPYCDDEVMEVDSPYCQACRVTIFYCPGCRKSIERDNKVCPYCGTEIKSL